MKLVGKDFAWRQMEKLGWAEGQGLGRHNQGRVDALKPKLKFDQAGIGHNRAEEFEFHWWDHIFNSAAKGITVDDSQGEVKVEFSSSKSELSTKKLRRRMQKEMRNKLYSHFVKSGTLTGGVLEKEANTMEIEEVKDMSQLKTMTDEELLKACGGRTAHKGARHGQKMSSKLSRVEEADRKFLAEMLAKANNAKLSTTDDQTKSQPLTQDKALSSADETVDKKEKKKKKKKNREAGSVEAPPVEINPEEEKAREKAAKKKKKRERKEKENLVCSSEHISPVDGSAVAAKKEKRKRKAETEASTVASQEPARKKVCTIEIMELEEELPAKKKKSKKRKKEKEAADERL